MSRCVQFHPIEPVFMTQSQNTGSPRRGAYYVVEDAVTDVLGVTSTSTRGWQGWVDLDDWLDTKNCE